MSTATILARSSDNLEQLLELGLVLLGLLELVVRVPLGFFRPGARRRVEAGITST